jgi:hypothetical protein
MSLVFRGVGQSDISSLVNQTITYLVASSVDEIPFHQFARRFSNDMDKLTMDRVMDTLMASKIIEVLNKPGMESTIKIIENKDVIMGRIRDENK